MLRTTSTQPTQEISCSHKGDLRSVDSQTQDGWDERNEGNGSGKELHGRASGGGSQESGALVSRE